MRMKRTLLIASLLALAIPAFAQDETPQEEYIAGIPASVYYLMPSFADGMVYFYTRTPAQGKLNICATDNTLRFIDNSGKELQASGDQGILKVRIDTVWFIKNQDYFYRMYPVTADVGIAVRREVKIIKGAREGAFGMTSQTSAIKEINKVYADGVSVDLNKDKKLPYEVTDLLYLYKGNAVGSFNKKSLKKVFPAKKDQIDQYFTTHKLAPSTLDKALELVAELAKQ